MSKSMNDWKSEALSFIHNWGGFPEYADVKSVCRDLSADETSRSTMVSECGSVDMYANELWLYIRREMCC